MDMIRGITGKFAVAAACLLAAAVSAQATNLAPYTTRTSTGSATFTWANPGGNYTAVLSTSSSFTAPISSASIALSTANYSSLNPNTTYYFKVKITNQPESQYSQISTATWAVTPGGIYSVPAFFTAESSFTAIASVGWNTGGNPEWTTYNLSYDVAPGFGSEIISPISNPQGAPLSVGGLKANTTYYFRVRARGVSGTSTAYTPAISTSTLALKLSGLSGSVYETTATVSWTAVNHATIQALKSEGYLLNLSLNAYMIPPFYATWTLGAATAFKDLSGLTLNTAYYYQVGALNWPGTANMGDTRSITTLAARPLNLARIAVADYTATLGWAALPAGTALGYSLEASTTNFTAGGLTHSSVSYRTDLSTLTITTLDPNTTYYFRAGSVNSAYAPNYGSSQSSVTLASPVSADLAYISVAAQAITVRFTPLPESPQALACEGYSLEGSSVAFGSGGAVFSSVTYTYQDQQRSLTLQGLAAYTTYYLRLGTINWERTPNYTVLPSTKTSFPGPLTGVSLNDIWSSSAAVSFTPGGASGGSVAEASVYRFFGIIYKSSATPNPSVSSLTISGLDPNTTYYFRAGGLYNGATLYSNAVPEFRQTLPQSLTGLNIPAVFQSSITVAWTPLPGSPQSAAAESYLLEADTGPAFSPVLFSSVTPNIGLNSLTISGLEPNTSYYFRAGAVNLEGYASYSAAPATSTMANPPVAYPALEQTFTNLTPTEMAINWQANSNPADTLYLVRISSNSSFATPVHSSSTKNNYASFTGLEPNTTYYPELTSYNRLNRPSPVVVFSSMATGAYDPEIKAYTGLGVSSVTLNWDDAIYPFNPAGTQYLAQVSSNSSFSGTVLSFFTKDITASFSGLVSNASYYLRVSALNLTGVPTDPAVSLGTALTLPAAARVLPWQEAFSDLKIDGFKLNWADNGNSSHTVYNIELSTYNTGISTDIAIATTSNFNAWMSTRTVSANALAYSFGDLEVGATYWAKIQAQGQTGVITDFVLTSTVTTLRASSSGVPTARDTLVTSTASYGVFSVFMPAGALGGYTNVTIQPESVFMPPTSSISDLDPTGVGVKINYFPPVLVLNVITIIVPYRIADLPAGADRARLVLALFDETNSIWVPLPSESDAANNRVIGRTWHLSTFQLMLSHPVLGLADVKIFPNPYRPNSVSDVMHFANMTSYATIKIYTFLGELVREIKSDVNGMASWTGINSDGRKTASGIYIAFIQSKDKKSSRSFKVAVER
ncbi:MAG: hypothetical protein Q7R35_06495 [Elusimicrobiota bacterium]|nr:hypothetical protein [Elusimicrobiota bacterium]